MAIIGQIQLGKQGLTDNFIGSLKDHFANHRIVKVSVLRSCCRNKKELKEINEVILKKLGKNFTSKMIGYTIVFKKWRKARR